MNSTSWDTDFETYRRDRNHRRAQRAEPTRPMGSNADVLRQLEAAEQREVTNERLSREVHDFFSDATRQAATILRNVSEEHEADTYQRMRCEIEEFLNDVIHHAEGFMRAWHLPATTGPNGEAMTEVEPHMKNLVGPLLDGFRHESNAQVADKHIGLDPFNADPGVFSNAIEAVDKASDESEASLDPTAEMGFEQEEADEFEIVHELTPDPDPDPAPDPAPPAAAEPQRADDNDYPSIEDHLVADVDLDPIEAPMIAEPTPEPTSEPAPGPDAEPGPSLGPVLERVLNDPARARTVLRSLVESGALTKSEAKEIYLTRVHH